MTYSPLRLRVAGVAAVAAIALSVLQVLLTPAHLDGSTHEMAAAAAAHATAAYAAGWCEMLWGLCAALACITVTGLVRAGRGSRLTAVGGWLNTISLLSLGFSTLAVSQVAIADRASDIHIEPGEHDLRVRFRIDGVLHDIMRSPRSIQAGVISRLKIMADLDISERRVPQDGRLSVQLGGKKIDLTGTVKLDGNAIGDLTGAVVRFFPGYSP